MTHVITIPGRVISTKNSRQIKRVNGKTKSVMSDAATAWMVQARAFVRRQWRGRPLQRPTQITVHAVFSNLRSLPDPDNVLNATLDALKRIVIIDDNLKCIHGLNFTHEVTPRATERLVITLTPVGEADD